MMAMEEAVSKTSRNALKPLFRGREKMVKALEYRVNLLQTGYKGVWIRIFREEVLTCRFLGCCGQRWIPWSLEYLASVMGDGPGVSW
jgi:hypothetical protein